MSFEFDKLQKNTNLIPLVKIDEGGLGIFISTNSVSISADQYKPLLASMPGVKESIDLETRKYKISSLTLNIYNHEVDGVRFSDSFSGSLFNKEVDISWFSPEYSYGYLNYQSAFQIFSGVVRKYDIGSNSIKITIEDRSQALLHKNLPLPDNWLKEGDDIPDKYKNKPIPQVYGSVDRSPCVITESPAVEEWGITEGSVKIQPDMDETISINNLYIFDNNYVFIPPTLSLEGDQSEIFDYPNGTIQFTTSDNIITLASSSGWDSDYVNPISFNQIIAYQEISGDSMTFKPLQQRSSFWSSTEGFNPAGHGSRSWYGSYLRNVNGVPSFYGSLFKESDEDDNDWGGSYYLWEDPNYPQTPYEEQFYHDIWNEDGGQNDKHEMKLVGGTIQTDAFTLSSAEESAGILWWKGELWVGNASASDHGWGTTSGDRRIYVRFGGDTYDDYDLYDHDVSIDDHLDDEFTQSLGSIPSDDGGWSAIDNTNQLLAYCRLPVAARMAVELKLTGLTLYNYSLIKDMLTQDFYVDVIGREGDSPRAEVMIENIITEIGQEVSLDGHAYYDHWQYAFVIDKKINSKQLLEGLSAASPYIPHFNNQGDFKLDIIRTTYSETDINNSNRILESDCISFSNSRTDLEQIFSKIEFKYNYDYARGEFNDSYTASTDDISEVPQLDGYSPLSYGMELDHSESTLVIDDDRGKYIRKNDPDNSEPTQSITAKEYAIWMLLWHCNPHLKIKVRLPLKYMDIEVGSLCTFDKVLGDIKPYGIDYHPDNSSFGAGYMGDQLNYQQIFPIFMCVESNKTLSYCEFTLIQMHNLSSEYVSRDEIPGCMDANMWNYSPEATFPTVCYDINSFVVGSPGGDNSCPFEVNPTGELAGDANADYSTNYADFNINWNSGNFLTTDDLIEYPEGTGEMMHPAKAWWLTNGQPVPGGLNAPTVWNYQYCDWVDTVYHKIIGIQILIRNLQGNYNLAGEVNLDSNEIIIPVDAEIAQYYQFYGGLDVIVKYEFEQTDPTFLGDSLFENKYENNTPDSEAEGDIIFEQPSQSDVWADLVGYAYEVEMFFSADKLDLESGYTEFEFGTGNVQKDIVKATYSLQVSPYPEEYYEIGGPDNSGTEATFSIIFSGYGEDFPYVATGDVNNDGIIDVLDIVIIVNHILWCQGGTPGVGGCLSEEAFIRGDITGDGIANVLDVVQIVNLILGG